MMTEETEFLKAQQQFQDLCELMRQAGRKGWRMDEIEGRAMPKLMRLGLEFLAGHVERAGTGDVGPEVAYDNRTLPRSQELHARRYLSIFGELRVERYIYAVREGQKAEYVLVMPGWVCRPERTPTSSKSGSNGCASKMLSARA
jgi:hypothetical protein